MTVILVNIQPTEATVVHVDDNPERVPALVITDGHATVWFSPRDSTDGPMLAAEFAHRLAQCAAHWRDRCAALAGPHEPAQVLRGRQPVRERR